MWTPGWKRDGRSGKSREISSISPVDFAKASFVISEAFVVALRLGRTGWQLAQLDWAALLITDHPINPMLHNCNAIDMGEF